MDSYTMFKGSVALVAGAGASTVVKRLIKQNVFGPETKMEKILMNVGVFAITGLVSDQVSTHTEKRIDSWRESYEKVSAAVVQAKDSEEVKEKASEFKDDVKNVFTNSKPATDIAAD